jgi:hypothetical protein
MTSACSALVLERDYSDSDKIFGVIERFRGAKAIPIVCNGVGERDPTLLLSKSPKHIAET